MNRNVIFQLSPNSCQLFEQSDIDISTQYNVLFFTVYLNYVLSVLYVHRLTPSPYRLGVIRLELGVSYLLHCLGVYFLSASGTSASTPGTSGSKTSASSSLRTSSTTSIMSAIASKAMVIMELHRLILPFTTTKGP